MINLASDYYNFNLEKTFVIPNGVSITNSKTQKKFDFTKGMEIVFFNGLDSSRRRGLKELINVLCNQRGIHLSVIGNHLTTDFKNIRFYNPMKEDVLQEFLNEKHVFIDNLFYMPFSTLALQAMALGMILIVSDSSGISSYIKKGKNGFVYNSQKPEEIGKILDQISNSMYQPEFISKNAIETIKSFRWELVALKYFNAYKKILK